MLKLSPFNPRKISECALHLNACQGITAVAIPAWVTSTVYTVGTRVVQSATYYQCATAHTSGTFADDLAAVKWVATTDGAVSVCSAWADQSGNLRHVSQASSGSRPFLITAGLNGRPTIKFGGIQTLTRAGITGMNSLAGATLFVVVIAASQASSGYFMCLSGTNRAMGSAVFANVYAGFSSSETVNAYGVFDIVGTNNVPMVYTHVFNGALTGDTERFKLYQNGFYKASTNSTMPAVLDNNITLLSVGNYSTYPILGQIAEIIIYPSALTLTQMNQVSLYLAHKYNISVALA